MSEWIQPEHREIDDFLIQWGRYLRSYPQWGHCGSIEHLWRSPQCWHPPEPRPPEPELKKALLIERQMRIVQKNPRKLLKFKYVFRADKDFIIKRLRPKDYDQALYTARQIILNLVRHELFPLIHGRFHGITLDSGMVTAHA